MVAGPGEAVGERQVGVEREARAEQGVLQEVSVVEAEIEEVSLGRFAVAVGKAGGIQRQDPPTLDQMPQVEVVGASEAHGKDTSGEQEPVLPQGVQRLVTETVHKAVVERFAGEETAAGDGSDRLRNRALAQDVRKDQLHVAGGVKAVAGESAHSYSFFPSEIPKVQFE